MSSEAARDAADRAFMAQALILARAQLGRVAPNPAVACLIVREGRIIAAGVTGDGGRPHAEEAALAEAAERAENAVAYVTLEPCNARSSGARSCAQALVEAGVARVVVACADPNPTAAHGVSRLGAAGVEITFGVLRAEAEALNAGFFKLTRTGRPWLTVDAHALGHDREFLALPGEHVETTLDRLGAAGVTRVFALSGSALAADLRGRGLIDEDRG